MPARPGAGLNGPADDGRPAAAAPPTPDNDRDRPLSVTLVHGGEQSAFPYERLDAPALIEESPPAGAKGDSL
jgi:hypothetical protein